MIFPILRGILTPLQAPITFLLLALNLFVFLGTADQFFEADSQLESLTGDKDFLEVQGLAFATMIRGNKSGFSDVLGELAQKSLTGDIKSRQILGTLAFRNVAFMGNAETFDFGGDEVALEKWRSRFVEVQKLQSRHPSYLWGISRIKSDLIQFVSYQFSHSGFLHLFWNMIFLLIFGSFIESKLGGSFVILTYLGSGVGGALAFASISGISAAPLIGASAAVSGLIALVGMVWHKREKLKFFFWLLPIDGYFGMISLPSWVILFVSLLPDLSGFFSTGRDFGAVAYSAHLGGAAFGVIMAIFYRQGILQKEAEDGPNDQAPQNPFRKAG